MPTIPDKYADLLSWSKRAYAYLALVMRNGSPHVTPVWFEFDGTHIVVNTARGRVKDKILHRRPHVALAIQDPDDVYRYLQVRGHVVEETETGGYETICRLSDKYTGNKEYPKRAGEARVTYKILPEHFSPHG